MSIKNYSYELLDSKSKPISSRAFFKAQGFNVYYQDRLSSISPQEFPWSLYFAEDKKEYLIAFIELLNERRERANELRRRRRNESKVRTPEADIKEELKLEKKKPKKEEKATTTPKKKLTKREEEWERIKKKYEPEVIEEEKKVVTKTAPKRFKIVQEEKEARGIFQQRKMKFKQTVLDYNGVYNVNPFESSGFSDLKNIIAHDFEELMNNALKGKKGERKFIIKLITPRYDLQGKKAYDDKIVDADFRPDKRDIKYEKGEHSKKVQSFSNYGFSLGRRFVASDNKENIKEELRRFMKSTLSEWSESLITKYMGMYSKIDISGIMLEEVMDSEDIAI